MATKERYQDPVADDTVNLRMFVFNANNQADFASIDSVKLYFLDPYERTEENPDGRRLVETITSDQVIQENTGQYLVQLELESPRYVVGRYLDVWTVFSAEGEPATETCHYFDVYPQKWYTTPIPVVYDFDFHFQPNKLRKGSNQYLRIEIIPRVPRASDLKKFYENLAIAANLSVSIEQYCGECVPTSEDLRLIVDDEDVEYREKHFGYYRLDTEDYDCGIYNIWFKLLFGSNVYVSDRMQFQVY